MKKRKLNSKGNIYYGLHIYPGVAEYHPEDDKPYRVLLNGSTLRKMDKTFPGRPLFVLHVDEVEKKVDKLRTAADGWVIESFYNAADGNHWTKFIAVTEKADSRIKAGWTLSNCYLPKQLGPGGLANGVSYQKEVLDGEYEHLALVPEPRYEKSIILTPDQFKKYNEDCEVELKRVANHANKNKTKGISMGFFSKTPVKNAAELAKTSVLLEKSGREVSLAVLVKEADRREVRKLKNAADPEAFVKVDGEKMTVAELAERYLNAKACMNEEDDDDSLENEVDDEEDDDDSLENEVDDEEDDDDEVVVKKKAKNKKAKTKNSIDELDDEEAEGEDDDLPTYSAKKSNGRANPTRKSRESETERRRKEHNRKTNERLRNAANRGGEHEDSRETVDLEVDQLARGKQRYGSAAK